MACREVEGATDLPPACRSLPWGLSEVLGPYGPYRVAQRTRGPPREVPLSPPWMLFWELLSQVFFSFHLTLILNDALLKRKINSNRTVLPTEFA